MFFVLFFSSVLHLLVDAIHLLHSVLLRNIIMRPEEVSPSYSPCPPLQYGSGIDVAPPATHDTSRVSYHVKQLDTFAQTLQEVSILNFLQTR